MKDKKRTVFAFVVSYFARHAAIYESNCFTRGFIAEPEVIMVLRAII